MATYTKPHVFSIFSCSEGGNIPSSEVHMEAGWYPSGFYEYAAALISAFHKCRDTWEAETFRVYSREKDKNIVVCCDEKDILFSLLCCCKDPKIMVREIYYHHDRYWDISEILISRGFVGKNVAGNMLEDGSWRANIRFRARKTRHDTPVLVYLFGPTFVYAYDRNADREKLCVRSDSGGMVEIQGRGMYYAGTCVYNSVLEKYLHDLSDESRTFYEYSEGAEVFLKTDGTKVAFSVLKSGKLYEKISRDDEKVIFHAALHKGVLLKEDSYTKSVLHGEGSVRRPGFWECYQGMPDVGNVIFEKDSDGEYRYHGENKEVAERWAGAAFVPPQTPDPDSLNEESAHRLCMDYMKAFCAGNADGLPESPDTREDREDTQESKEIDTVTGLRKRLKEKLKEKVKGQDMAVEKFVDGYIRYQLRGKTAGKPAGLYLFAGPPGTGKTYLAETFANLTEVANDGYRYKRFDMSVYGGNSSAADGLVGFEETWKSAQEGHLTGFVRKNPKCILLFDEIEKATPQVRYLFLSVLEGAVLKDKYHKEDVSFEDAILIFTTNEGKDLYEDNRGTNLTALPDSAVTDGLQASKFPPELISRFLSGTIVMFNQLDYFHLSSIFKASVEAATRQICRSWRNLDFELIYDDAYEDKLPKLYLLSKGDRIDARFVSANARTMTEDCLLKVVEYMGKRYPGKLKELRKVSVSVEVTDEVRTYFERTEKPRILVYAEGCTEISVGSAAHLRGDFCPEENLEKLGQMADCHRAGSEDEFRERLQKCNWNSRSREEKYDAILIDLGGDSRIRSDDEGCRCLKAAAEAKPDIPVIVVDRGIADEITSLLSHGATDYVQGAFYEPQQTDRRCAPADTGDVDESEDIGNPEGAIDAGRPEGAMDTGRPEGTMDAGRPEGAMDAGRPEGSGGGCQEEGSLVLDSKELEAIFDRQYFVKAAASLARKGKRLSGDTSYDYEKESGELKILFANLRVREATEEDAESRRQNRKYLLAEKPQVRLQEDVYGNKAAKDAVERCIDNIKNPEKYRTAGAKLMTGILMYGQPGMGKTMFAKAMAFEANASYISVAGSDFCGGDGIIKMEEMFRTARRKRPCILFIDEFDAISKHRFRRMMGTLEEAVLEKFLKEMSGMETDNDGVYVVAATNYPLEQLDPAVVRRFSSKICFPYPSMDERQEFLLDFLEKKNLKDQISERAAWTLNRKLYQSARSYGEIKTFIEESIADAVYKKEPVTEKFLFNRIHDEVDGAARQQKSKDKYMATAFHEAGHAVLMNYFGEKLDYVTIISRGNYGGYALAESMCYTGQDFLDRICVCFAGRAAETVYMEDISRKEGRPGINVGAAGDPQTISQKGGRLDINVGAAGDLQTATGIAYDYVCRYGLDMDNKRMMVVPEAFASPAGGCPETVLPESEKEAIWTDVKQILDQQWAETMQLLKRLWDRVEALAWSLIYMQELDGEKAEQVIESKTPYIDESCLLDPANDYLKEMAVGAGKKLHPKATV